MFHNTKVQICGSQEMTVNSPTHRPHDVALNLLLLNNGTTYGSHNIAGHF